MSNMQPAQQHHPVWDILRLCVVISPFWLVASDWSDGSELKASVMAAAVAGAMKLIDRREG